MSDRWVVNASPVIALARAGFADWLGQLADEVVIPEAVVAEAVKALLRAGLRLDEALVRNALAGTVGEPWP